MGENSDDNDPFEEDIVFDQSGLLTSRSSYSRQQITNGIIPTFMLFIRTVFLCVAFTGLGLCASVSQGPIIHLEVAVGIPIQKAFHSFTAHSVGMLIGGMLGSVLFEIYNRQFLIFVSLLWMSVSVSILPFTIPVSYWWTLVNLAALGAGLSFLFTGSNVLCLDLWGKQGGASLQSLHFSFALGAFIAPIIIHPFISGAFPGEIGEIQEINISAITVSPHSTFSDKIKRSLDTMPSDMILDSTKIKNLTISSTSLENLTLPLDLAKIGTVFNVSSTMNPLVTDNTSLVPTTVEIVSNETENAKPKPKPSFTNGNSIPENDKWKRPPPKDTDLVPDAKTEKVDDPANTSDKSTEHPADKSSITTNTTEKPGVTTNSTAKTVDIKSDLATLIDGKMLTTKNADNSSIGTIISTTEVPVVSVLNDFNSTSDKQIGSTNSSKGTVMGTESLGSIEKTTTTASVPFTSVLQAITTERTQVDSKVVTNISSVTSERNIVDNSSDRVTAFDTPIKDDSSNVSNAKNIPLSQSTVAETVVKMSMNVTVPIFVQSTTLASKPKEDNLIAQGIAVTPLPSTTSEDAKYAIEYNNNSYAYWGDEKYKDSSYSDMGGDFTDYSAPSVKDGVSDTKASLTEPELLDLKEEPSKDDEASTISVTASFSNDGVAKITNHQAKPGTYSNATDTNSRFFESLVIRFKNYGLTSIHFIYICIGIFLLINAFISVIIMCHNPREPRSKQEDLSGTTLNKVFFFAFSVYMFASEAVEGAVRHLLASSQTENGIPIASKGLDGVAVFWGLVCIMRFLCILIFGFLKVKAGKILVASTFFTVVGTIFLCIGTFDKQDFLWGGIVVIALGLAPVIPTSFLWMAEHMRISHRLCALMIVISSFGNSLTHTTLTHVLANSHLYAYILIGISLCAMIFLSASFCILYKAQSTKRLTVPIGYHLANQEEEETLELTRPDPKTFDNINRRLSEMGEAGQALLID